MDTGDQEEQVLQLITQGRTSGRAEVDHLPYRLKDDCYVVVATNQHQVKPDWYLNLKEEPMVELKLGGARFHARAETPTGNARIRLAAITRELTDAAGRIPRETATVVLSPLC